MSSNLRQTPLTCSGHTRPVVFIAFSEFNPKDAANYYCIAACKGKLYSGIPLSSRLFLSKIDILPPISPLPTVNHFSILINFQMENQCYDKVIQETGLVLSKDTKVPSGVSISHCVEKM